MPEDPTPSPSPHERLDAEVDKLARDAAVAAHGWEDPASVERFRQSIYDTLGGMADRLRKEPS